MRNHWCGIILVLLVGGLIAASAQESNPDAAWQQVEVKGGTLEIHPAVTWKGSLPQGPFVRLGDGGILGIQGTNAIVSHDEGETWETRPLFSPDQNLKVSSERAMVRTADGTIVLVFMNMAEYTWKWNAEKSLPEPETDLDVWAIRSVDDGNTWIDAQKIYDGYCGDVHSMIQTSQGTLVTPVQELMYEDGRHALRPRYSTDDGKTWHRSNFLDIGGRGHHDGLIEGTLVELKDGRVWLLCRTNLGEFWSTYSPNHGEDFRTLQPSGIPASSSPGTLTRLASGRLLLVWNRPIPEGLDATPEDLMRGGDNQWSDERVSNHRGELSVAFSEDDGATWTEPVVIARRPGASLAYSYVFEAQPGTIWMTTMQGDVRVAFEEEELLGR
ncbi:MAG: hypothetical protein AMXMBFR82_53000 [Candidatus Hydrogenedentota bacterium]